MVARLSYRKMDFWRKPQVKRLARGDADGLAAQIQYRAVKRMNELCGGPFEVENRADSCGGSVNRSIVALFALPHYPLLFIDGLLDSKGVIRSLTKSESFRISISPSEKSCAQAPPERQRELFMSQCEVKAN